MNQMKEEMIRRAQETYREILPCTTKKDLTDCFTTEEGRICFWFNTADKTTHMITAKI